jgi:hypothetical protein
MASKFILIVKDGEIVERPLRKPQAPRNLYVWKCAAAGVALRHRTKHYAFRYDGCWHVLGVGHLRPLKTFGSEHRAAAEMWLIMRVSR